MPTPTIQLICFDLGGVLIRLCDSWEHACQRAGVTPTKSLSDDDKKQLVKLVHLEEVGELGEGEFFTLASPLLGLSPADAKAMSDAWLCGAFYGVDALIDALNAAGHTTACLSNTNDNHWRAMTNPAHPNALPLEKLHHRFASHLVKDRKPNPSIYQHVEQATNTRPGTPEDTGTILFFDDSAENIHAAQAQGWLTCHVTDADDPVAQMTSHLKRHNLL
jgi:HAD superfamily hydrolase (TIGR01509 family)